MTADRWDSIIKELAGERARLTQEKWALDYLISGYEDDVYKLKRKLIESRAIGVVATVCSFLLGIWVMI